MVGRKLSRPLLIIINGGNAMRAVNIQWDTDGQTDLNLPDEIELPDELTNGEIDYEGIEDYISDQTGFCHFGYDLE